MKPTEGKSENQVPTPQGSTVRPFQGRKNFVLSCRSVGFTYGYSMFSPPGRVERRRRCGRRLTLSNSGNDLLDSPQMGRQVGPTVSPKGA